MTTHEIIDDFGRRITFEGVELMRDGDDRSGKPRTRYEDIVIWRTTGGNYVYLKKLSYRIFHTSRDCPRADRQGTALVPAQDKDVLPCNVCGRDDGEARYGQAEKTLVDIYTGAAGLVVGLAVIDHNTGQARYPLATQDLLADLSELDPAVHAVWMDVHVA